MRIDESGTAKALCHPFPAPVRAIRGRNILCDGVLIVDDQDIVGPKGREKRRHYV